MAESRGACRACPTPFLWVLLRAWPLTLCTCPGRLKYQPLPPASPAAMKMKRCTALRQEEANESVASHSPPLVGQSASCFLDLPVHSLSPTRTLILCSHHGNSSFIICFKSF